MKAQAIILAAAVLTTGCAGSLPTIESPGAGCQVRAGAVAPEGSFGGGTVAAVGGAATVVGTCPPEFRVFTRSSDGSVVCYGTDAWCASALDATPLDVTPAQLRELMQPVATPGVRG